jgi:hypothetical protein
MMDVFDKLNEAVDRFINRSVGFCKTKLHGSSTLPPLSLLAKGGTKGELLRHFNIIGLNFAVQIAPFDIEQLCGF